MFSPRAKATVYVTAIVLALGAGHTAAPPAAAAGAPGPGGVAPSEPAEAPAPKPPSPSRPEYAVGTATLALVDRSRSIRLPGGRRVPRYLPTLVRYPAEGSPGVQTAGAPPARAPLAFPLVVFAHGFAVTPAIYARLLDSLARAGYVVAAPTFPLERAGAPGGPDEEDLVNEPGDIRFVISSLLAASARTAGPLSGLIDPRRTAVAGQSDGGEAALAAAYSRRLRDPRIGAAIVLSGAEMGGVGGYRFASGGPPLLAVQGTADKINEPRFTYAYFKAAHRPKFLLRLLGASHLPPYTFEQPQLGIVENTTIAFLDRYLRADASGLARLLTDGRVSGVAALTAEP